MSREDDQTAADKNETVWHRYGWRFQNSGEIELGSEQGKCLSFLQDLKEKRKSDKDHHLHEWGAVPLHTTVFNVGPHGKENL